MKNISSVIAGFVVGVILLMLLEMLVPVMYPLPFGLDFSQADYEVKKFLVDFMPTNAKILLLACAVVASFAGGFVSVLISKKIIISLIVGGSLTLANIFNLVQNPHPFWVAVTSMFMFVPIAFAGGKIGMLFGEKKYHAN